MSAYYHLLMQKFKEFVGYELLYQWKLYFTKELSEGYPQLFIIRMDLLFITFFWGRFPNREITNMKRGGRGGFCKILDKN